MKKNLLNQIVMTGKISSVNATTCTAQVYFEDLDKVSGDLRVLMNKTQGDKDYWLPEVGEMVECLLLPIGITEGVILGSTYNSEDLPPWDDSSKIGSKFKNGSFWCFNRTTGKLDINIVEQINITAPQLTLNCEQVTISGTVSAQEFTAAGVSLAEHRHTGNQGSPTSPPIK